MGCRRPDLDAAPRNISLYFSRLQLTLRLPASARIFSCSAGKHQLHFLLQLSFVQPATS